MTESEVAMEEWLTREIKSFIDDHKPEWQQVEDLSDIGVDMVVFAEHFDKYEILAGGGVMILDERSLMQKAIKINEKNKSRLVSQYAEEDSDFFDKDIGMWLIADFGAEIWSAIVDQTTFDENFEVATMSEGMPIKLNNGYVAIIPKQLAEV